MKANHKKIYVQIDGLLEPITVMPGQFITGRNSLHKSYYKTKSKKNKSPITLWRNLQVLENMQNLNIKSYTKYTMITITNWELYQQDEQQLNNNRTTTEQQVNTNKNDKNDKNDKNKNIYVLPEWFPDKIWKEFLSHRIALKVPVKKESYQRCITKFEKWRSSGYEPDKVLDYMIEKGWRSFNPDWVKENNNGKRIRDEKLDTGHVNLFVQSMEANDEAK